MQSWVVSDAGGRSAHAALAGVISCVGRERFGATALEHLNDALQVGSWSVYQLWPDRAPVMHLSASRQRVDSTGQCFATYRDAGLYRRDSSFAAVRGARAQEAVMLRMHADDAPSADHREAIYLRHGLVERLSVARAGAGGSLLAVNAYRHRSQGAFGGAELERFGLIAPGLLATVERQLQWTADARPPDRRAALRQRCAALTERELDVLERLLQGLTYDGIAADLSLSVGTVKTYRARAFARLDLRFRNELFAAFLPAGG